jgi:hypothetical protein
LVPAARSRRGSGRPAGELIAHIRVVLVRAAKALRDEELLTAAKVGREKAERRRTWVRTRVKEVAPQVLAAGAQDVLAVLQGCVDGRDETLPATGRGAIRLLGSTARWSDHEERPMVRARPAECLLERIHPGRVEGVELTQVDDDDRRHRGLDRGAELLRVRGVHGTHAP